MNCHRSRPELLPVRTAGGLIRPDEAVRATPGTELLCALSACNRCRVLFRASSGRVQCSPSSARRFAIRSVGGAVSLLWAEPRSGSSSPPAISKPPQGPVIYPLLLDPMPAVIPKPTCYHLTTKLREASCKGTCRNKAQRNSGRVTQFPRSWRGQRSRVPPSVHCAA